MTTTKSSIRRRPSPAAIVIVPIVVALLVTLFAWPSARLEPRDLPVAVAGPPAAASMIEQRLAKREDAFDVKRYPDEAAAREAIEDRAVYGAFVSTPAGLKVLTASAASPAVAQLLSHAANEGQAHAQSATARVQDVVPAPAPATALSSAVFPLILAGTLTGMASALLTSGLGRAGLVVLGSVLGGLVATAIVQGWLDIVGGDWGANAAALSLMILAIATVVTGLHALLGRAGAILGTLTMVLLGNPFSGVWSGPEMLPQPVGAIGQLMPPGAGGNLLRSTGFFDGAAAGGHVAVLVAWSLVGLAAIVAAAARARRPAAAFDAVTEAQAADASPEPAGPAGTGYRAPAAHAGHERRPHESIGLGAAR